MKTTTFENAIIGDAVYSIIHGWGRIVSIETNVNFNYLLEVMYPDQISTKMYTLKGTYGETHPQQILFWDEVSIIAPEKPQMHLPVDTKVIVWDGVSTNKKYRRYFSHFSKGKMYCFKSGADSWSGKSNTSTWDHWELV